MGSYYKSSSVSSKSTKISDVADTVSVGSIVEGIGFDQLNVSFTPSATGGNLFKAVSNPGSFIGISSTSPIPVKNLTPGTSYTFTVSGANGGPNSSASSANIPTGAIVPIATSTLSVAGGFSFSNIPQGYQDLELVIQCQYAGSGFFGSYMALNDNSPSGLTSFIRMFSDGASVATDYYTNQTDFNWSTMSGVNSTNIFASQKYYFSNYSSTNKWKSIISKASSDTNGSGYSFLSLGSYRNNSPITKITFGASGYSNLSIGSKATLFGIKAAQ